MYISLDSSLSEDTQPVFPVHGLRPVNEPQADLGLRAGLGQGGEEEALGGAHVQQQQVHGAPTQGLQIYF